MSAGNPEAKKVSEFGAFDILRFVLASAVLFAHLDIFTWEHAGNLAVQVFFSLSGWLIGSILLNTKASELGRFYFNRSTRVWAPYFFAVFALYSASYVYEPVLSSRWHEFLIYDLTFTHNWFTLRPTPEAAFAQTPLGPTGHHFWSLATEEQFYLIAPLIVTLLPFGRKASTWMLIAFVAVATGSQYGAISMGVLAAVLNKNIGAWHLNKGWTGLILAVVSFFTAYEIYATHLNSNDYYVYLSPLFSIALVLLLARPFPRTGITKLMGGVSFPLYLNAWLGIRAGHVLGRAVGLDDSYFVPIYDIAFALTVATVLYYLIDRQILMWRDRIFNNTLGWAMGAMAYSGMIIGIIYGNTVSF